MLNNPVFALWKLRERLWFQPLIYCVIAIAGLWLATLGNRFDRPEYLDTVNADMLEMLLRIISTSMLTVATFAVGSLVSAYASASAQGTPRAFQVLVGDDSSRNALSSFIGAFIFSILALVALRLELLYAGGYVTLFGLTMLIFVWVVLTFVSWTDNIARLGRMNTIIQKVETATIHKLVEMRKQPSLGGVPADDHEKLSGSEIYADIVGHLQTFNMKRLQHIAMEQDCKIAVTAEPGALIRPGAHLAVVSKEISDTAVLEKIRNCFSISAQRDADSDPRFGLLILSEIASRALSPGVNDPGTAIVVIGRLSHLLNVWAQTRSDDTIEEEDIVFDRVIVGGLEVDDVFTDAFRAISRDGAGLVEVAVNLMKALESLAAIPDSGYRDPANRVAKHTFARCRAEMEHDFDLDAVRKAAGNLQI